MDLLLFAELIREQVRVAMENHRISGNFVDTITVVKEEDGSVSIKIPAEIYDMSLYKKSGVIQYTGEGSYAQYVNNRPKVVNKAIKEAVRLYGEQTGKILEVGK